MFRLTVLTILILLLLVVPVLAEVSVGAKLGYVNFFGGGDEYNDNGGFDSELAYGIYVKRREGNNYIRFDYDRLETGNEFSQHLSIPYEQVDIYQHIFGVTVGQYWNWLYWGCGLDICINQQSEIELYPGYTDTVKVENSFGTHFLLGAEVDISDNMEMFIEAKYLITEAGVIVNNSKEFEEDLGGLGLYAGAGLKLKF